MDAGLWRALTLTQPWATLIATGEKQVETRSWQTSYRGPLLIHAAAGFPPSARRRCMAEPIAAALRRHGYHDPGDLPRGAFLASCRLVAIHRVTSPADVPAGDEASFGNYAANRFTWVLADVQALRRPIPARGRLGLWEAGPLPG